ncbi:helix-turn-helix domain-containing protein [Thalassomonas haliotis]|uniref:AraC family transcriptional regulator n=1 Tax=Thalassomonas haliotis TaxID=485448 RepID=A0ABY7VAY3_9GAMM|nr:helix-turn-helix domain-containing protein [Thalassomonas haliotis]WDE10696.1 AraC family transcriptional regulator [Thalassomonas haliotis]
MTINGVKAQGGDDFLQQLAVRQVLAMFDLMPDMLFWVKDAEGGIRYANQYFLEYLGLGNLSQAIGCSDYDFSPDHIARQFVVDDQKVMQGEVVTNRLEMNSEPMGDISWFITSKRPLYNDKGQVIGSYGISRHLEKTSIAISSMEVLKVPVDYIRKHYAGPVTLKELAQASHLSVSALERRFKKYLKKTPKQFINEVRLENARRLLVETTLPIATVAIDSGFGDPSYFSRQFYRLFAQRPSDFRKNHCREKLLPGKAGQA